MTSDTNATVSSCKAFVIFGEDWRPARPRPSVEFLRGLRGFSLRSSRLKSFALLPNEKSLTAKSAQNTRKDREESLRLAKEFAHE
jgi:hypothetical protein